MVKVVYPVEEYISAYKLNFEGLELLQDLRKEKLDILDEIADIVSVDFEVARDLFKNYLIKTGTYNEEQFEEKIRTIISSNPRLEDDMELHVKGVEIQIKNWLSEVMKFLSTIKQMGKTGPIEDAIINLTLQKEGVRKLDNLEILLTSLSKTYLEFSEKKAIILDRLQQLIPSSQVFTLRQKKILEDVVNLAELAERSINVLKFYDETRYVTDALIWYYEGLPESQRELEDLRDIQSELSTIYLVVEMILRTPYDESRMIDEHLTYINEIMANRMQKRGYFESEYMGVQETRKRKEYDRAKVETQLRKPLSTKRYAREQLMDLERDLTRIGEEEGYAAENLNKIDSTIGLYQNLARRFELISDYRKRLGKIVDLHKEYTEKIAEIAAPKKYYVRNADLTESEQFKIIFKILTEQEEGLTNDVIFRDIIDMEHFKDYMKSVIRTFKTPAVMGYKPSYRTDYLWVTVQAPPKLWTEEMSQEVYVALAGYVTSEVSRTITVRVIEARDPWEARILVLAGRGKPEDMEAYDEMKLLYNKSSDFERHLSRSYLLEHGVSATQIVKEINGQGNEADNNAQSDNADKSASDQSEK
jgi:hypothetical protein